MTKEETCNARVEENEDVLDFLARVRGLEQQDEVDDAVFAVLLKFDTLLRARDFGEGNRILATADVTVMTEDLMVAFLTATAPAKRQLLQRAGFYTRVCDALRGTRIARAEIAEILEGLG